MRHVLLPLPAGEGWGEGTWAFLVGLRLFRGRSREFAPAGDLLSFASPKESKQRKGDPTARVPPLRYGQPAVLASPACRRTRCVHFVHAAQTAAASQMLKPACPSAGGRPTPLRSSARAEGIELQRAMARTWALGCWLFDRPSAAMARAVPPPLWLRRGAQCSRPHACRRTGMLRGLTCRSCPSRVNEVNAASSAAGRLCEHRRLPPKGDADSGVAFLWLLSLAKQRK